MQRDGRLAWLVLGVVCGLAIASLWPHEPLSAASADRNQKFAMVTTPVGGTNEGVFILDFLTGRLTGAVPGRSRTGTEFLLYYFRSIAEDFKVAGGEPYYAISAGLCEIQARGNQQWGNSAIYVAELNSGKVAAYAIPYRITQQEVPVPVQLVPLDTFPFREANVAE